MGEFFKGWRRKAGLVTLVMACVLMVGWMRSYASRDLLRVHVPYRYACCVHYFESFRGVLGWSNKRSSDVDPEKPLTLEWVPKGSWQYHPDVISTDPWRDRDLGEIHRDWHWAGFGLKAAALRFNSDKLTTTIELSNTSQWTTPYWSLVLMLTLLSAWLILWKPRKAKEIKESNRG